MSTRVIGSCKLCQKNAVELCDSHILPAWAYKRARGDKTPPVVVEDNKAFYCARQASEYMLCPECEQRFSRREKLVAELAYPEQSASHAPFLDAVGPVVRVADSLRAALPGKLDTAALAYFGVSVVWRASISRQMDACRLGDRYNEEFRRYLLGLAELPEKAACVVSFHDLRGEENINLSTVSSTPVTVRCQRGGTVFFAHRFAILGLSYFLAVGGRIPQEIRSFCVVRSPERLVMLAPQAALLNWIGPTFGGARPVGSLAKARPR